MDRAAGAVAGELGKVEDFGDRALAGEGRVAMEQDGQHLAAIDFGSAFAEHALAGAGFAFDHRVHRLEVAWVGGEIEAHLAVGKLADAFVAEVVFHIAIAGDEVGLVVGSEFVEQRGDRLANEIGKHIEATAVGHAHFDFAHAIRWAGFENRIE